MGKMGIKEVRKYTDRELMTLLDKNIAEGWSVASFPASIKVTQTSFYIILKEKPYFANYYRRIVKERQRKYSTCISIACAKEE